MTRALLILVMTYSGFALAGGDGPLITKIKTKVSAAIPSGCKECMAQCPHDSREMKECDRGCPDSCSQAQVAAYNQQAADSNGHNDCYTCMNGCPHSTKDPKPCDSGCASVCDSKGLRAAFIKANGIAKSCSNVSPIDDNARVDYYAPSADSEDAFRKSGGGGSDSHGGGGGESSSSR